MAIDSLWIRIDDVPAATVLTTFYNIAFWRGYSRPRVLTTEQAQAMLDTSPDREFHEVDGRTLALRFNEDGTAEIDAFTFDRLNAGFMTAQEVIDRLQSGQLSAPLSVRFRFYANVLTYRHRNLSSKLSYWRHKRRVKRTALVNRWITAVSKRRIIILLKYMGEDTFGYRATSSSLYNLIFRTNAIISELRYDSADMKDGIFFASDGTQALPSIQGLMASIMKFNNPGVVSAWIEGGEVNITGKTHYNAVEEVVFTELHRLLGWSGRRVRINGSYTIRPGQK